jgi:hypothetical protein
MNQQRIHTRFTKIKEEEDCDNESETTLDSGLKIHCAHAATIDAGQMYIDQTGLFLLVSSKGNNKSWFCMSIIEMPLWQSLS